MCFFFFFFFFFFWFFELSDLVAYIFKKACEYKQCTSNNRIKYNLDSFSYETCTSFFFFFFFFFLLLFSERSKTIYSYFVLLLIKVKNANKPKHGYILTFVILIQIKSNKLFNPTILLAGSKSPDQTVRMLRLILPFAVRIWPKTRFRMAWLL